MSCEGVPGDAAAAVARGEGNHGDAVPAQSRKCNIVVGVVAMFFLDLWLAAELAAHVCFLCLWITRGERG